MRGTGGARAKVLLTAFGRTFCHQSIDQHPLISVVLPQGGEQNTSPGTTLVEFLSTFAPERLTRKTDLVANLWVPMFAVADVSDIGYTLSRTLLQYTPNYKPSYAL